MDNKLSTDKANLYIGKNSNDIAMVKRGTSDFKDVMTDAKLVFGYNDKRFNEPKEILNKIKQKYTWVFRPKVKIVIFNKYKTDRKYGQQVFKLTDPALNKIIDSYIKIKKLKEGDYIFSLETDKQRPLAQSNFSKIVTEVHYKVYKEPINLRFLRMSWATWLY